ncbi:unnamed protein product [Sympodiomycopsis kandeliae]
MASHNLSPPLVEGLTPLPIVNGGGGSGTSPAVVGLPSIEGDHLPSPQNLRTPLGNKSTNSTRALLNTAALNSSSHRDSSTSAAARNKTVLQEVDEFENEIILLEHLGEQFYHQLESATTNNADARQVQESLHLLVAHLQHLLTTTSQTSIGGLPLSTPSTQDTSLSEEIQSLSNQGSTLYNSLRNIVDANGIVSSVLSGGRGR